MTIALYREDVYLSSARATVTAIRPDGGIELERTIFYATSGGQIGDTGFFEMSLACIGKDALIDSQPCGGTHVARTSEVGDIHIAKIEKKGRENRRFRLRFGSASDKNEDI